MLVTDFYSLGYTALDQPQHIMKQVSGVKHKAMEASSAASVNVAEWMLNKIEYESKQLLKTETRLGTIDKEEAVKIGTYLKHIHSNCRDEIQSKFKKPLLSDEEVGEIFFKAMIEDYDLTDDAIQKGYETGNSILKIECGKRQETATKESSSNSNSRRTSVETSLLALISKPW